MGYRCAICHRASRSAYACGTSGCPGALVASGPVVGVLSDEPDDDDDDAPASSDEAAELVPMAALGAVRPVRVRTGLPAWDAVLSGGLVRGAVVLVSGGSGSGKSHDALAIVAHVGGVYVSAEMDAMRLAETARRTGVSMARVGATFDPRVPENARLVLRERPRLVVWDSLPYLLVPDERPRTDAARLSALLAIGELARETRSTMLVVLHATKAGEVRGGSELIHEADGVVWVTRRRLEVREKWRFGPPKCVERTTGRIVRDASEDEGAKSVKPRAEAPSMRDGRDGRAPRRGNGVH